jgi:hypothetical protein
MKNGAPDPEADVTAIFAAGTSQMLHSLVEQHAIHASAPVHPVEIATSGDVTGEADDVMGAVDGAKEIGVDYGSDDESVVTAWVEAAPSPTTAYCSKGAWRGAGKKTVLELGPLLRVLPVLKGGSHGGSKSGSNSAHEAQLVSPMGSSMPSKLQVDEDSPQSVAAFDSRIDDAGTRLTALTACKAAGALVVSMEQQPALRSLYESLLRAKLARKRSAVEAGKNRVALETHTTLNNHQVLAEVGCPINAPWGSLILALKQWGWDHSTTAHLSYTWEWKLRPKAGKDEQVGEEERKLRREICRWYHKDVSTRFYNNPDPARKDDEGASLLLRQHLRDYPRLWDLVVAGPYGQAMQSSTSSGGGATGPDVPAPHPCLSAGDKLRFWIETYKNSPRPDPTKRVLAVVSGFADAPQATRRAKRGRR